MIYEYALAPELLEEISKSSEAFESFLEQYGIGTPRFISSFPRSSKKDYIEYLKGFPFDVSGLAETRITEAIKHIKSSCIERNVEVTINELMIKDDWKKFVCHVNQSKPFQGILTPCAINSQNNIIYEERRRSELWKVPEQIRISRTEADFLEHLKFFIRNSSEKIIIIDPYSYKEKGVKFIIKLLNLLSTKNINRKLPKIRIIYRFQDAEDYYKPSNILHKIISGLNVDLKKINIELFQISPKENSDAFHNRYVLSELGGIHLGHGIDLSNKPNQKDHLSIIKDDIYMEMCCMYEEELEENFQIVGKESIN